MDAKLIVTPEELQNAATKFSTSAGAVQELTNDMLNKVNNLSSVWTGNASNAYLQKFSALKASMEKLYNMIMEYCNDMNTIAETYINAEQEAQSLAEGLQASTL